MQSTNWEGVFGAYLRDKGLVFLICKEFLQSSKKRRNFNGKIGKIFDREL